jgi:hypothetical protein
MCGWTTTSPVLALGESLCNLLLVRWCANRYMASSLKKHLDGESAVVDNAESAVGRG